MSGKHLFWLNLQADITPDYHAVNKGNIVLSSIVYIKKQP